MYPWLILRRVLTEFRCP